MSTETPLERFFSGQPEAQRLFDAVCRLMDEVGPYQLRTTKSQIALRRRVAFAWAWRPGMYLRGRTPPLVLSVRLLRRDDSPRWKEIAEPYPGRFMHHLELWDESQLDAEVRGWLAEAWLAAG